MSLFLSSLFDKGRMFEWLRTTMDLFMFKSVSREQQDQIRKHIAKMEAYQSEYEIKCEVSKDWTGKAMKLIIIIAPRAQ